MSPRKRRTGAKHDSVTLTQDGRVITTPRAALVNDKDALAIMRKDIRALRLPPEGDDFSELVALGWSTNQCRRLFASALRAVHADSMAQQGVEAFALLTFLAGVICACFAMAGTPV